MALAWERGGGRRRCGGAKCGGASRRGAAGSCREQLNVWRFGGRAPRSQVRACAAPPPADMQRARSTARASTRRALRSRWAPPRARCSAGRGARPSCGSGCPCSGTGRVCCTSSRRTGSRWLSGTPAVGKRHVRVARGLHLLTRQKFHSTCSRLAGPPRAGRSRVRSRGVWPRRQSRRASRTRRARVWARRWGTRSASRTAPIRRAPGSST